MNDIIKKYPSTYIKIGDSFVKKDTIESVEEKIYEWPLDGKIHTPTVTIRTVNGHSYTLEDKDVDRILTKLGFNK
jgi:uncharacterized protein YlzI (FlbEa/FlbD family)